MATTTEDRPQSATKRAARAKPADAAPKPARKPRARAATAETGLAEKVGAEKAAVTRRARSAVRSTTKSVRSSGKAVGKAARQPAGLAVAAGAAGLVAGLAANFVRKAIVQAPTVAAGQWDEALKAEHEATLAIFDRIEATTEANTTRRATLLTQLKHALAKHALQEENVVYAALRDHAQKVEADKLNHEHGYVKQYLYDLTQIDRASPRWIATVREFRSMIQDHMREEEQDIFPKMRAALTEEENGKLTLAMNKEGLKIA